LREPNVAAEHADAEAERLRPFRSATSSMKLSTKKQV
jgi:hypothetical protein